MSMKSLATAHQYEAKYRYNHWQQPMSKGYFPVFKVLARHGLLQGLRNKSVK